MIRRWAIHGLPKQGAAEREYEDAVAGPVVQGRSARVAIADGATESAFARAWASRLVEFAAAEPLAQAVAGAREHFDPPGEPSAGTSWYAEAKRAEGAHATILAVEIRDDGDWFAEAVGDCVVVQLRDGRLLHAWPIDDPAAFDDRPALVSSLDGGRLPVIAGYDGQWVSGDVLLLATDALAAYLLAHGTGEALGLDEAGFAAFIGRARRHGMRNDDVTLIEIHLS